MRLTLSRLAPLALLATACAEGKDPPPRVEPVLIQGGSFTMGSEDFDPCGRSSTSGIACVPLEQSEIVPHSVEVASFCIDRTEVTVEQYRHCEARDECSKPQITNTGQIQTPSYIRRYYNEPETYRDHPVVGITHGQAKAFCESKGGRLPSEAEWEFVATSRGTRAATVWSEDDAGALARLIEGACPEARGQIALGQCSDTVRPVGSSARDVTAQGVHDLAGNVSEWVADEFDFVAYCQSTEGFEVIRRAGQDNFVRFQGGGVPGGLITDGPAEEACVDSFTACEQVCRRNFRDFYDADLEVERNQAFLAEVRRDWQRDHCYSQFHGISANLGDPRGLGPDFMCDPQDTRWCDSSPYMDAPASTCADYCGCLTADLAGAPVGGNACVNRCVDNYTACVQGAVAEGAAIACNRDGTRRPTPWCVPAQGRTGKDVRTGVPPRLRFYENDIAHVVRGGDVGTARVCEARPTRRQARNGAVSIVGFRCAYDLVGGACPAIE